MTRAYVGLGANLGNAARSLETALAALARLPHTVLAARSSLYASAPVDAAGEDFVNAVAALDTTLTAPALLRHLQAIEQAHGRERPYRNAARTLDLDILLYGSGVSDDPHLTLPHPRMSGRAFVIVPLLEIAPHLALPDGTSVLSLLAGVADQRIARLPLGQSP